MIYYTSRIKHNNKMMTDKYYKNATLVDQVEEKLKDYIMSLEPVSYTHLRAHETSV